MLLCARLMKTSLSILVLLTGENLYKLSQALQCISGTNKSYDQPASNLFWDYYFVCFADQSIGYSKWCHKRATEYCDYVYLIFPFLKGVLCYAILQPFHSLMGPIHNAGTGDFNDSIKARSSVSASGWRIDWAPVRVKEGQVDRTTHAWTYTHRHAQSSL